MKATVLVRPKQGILDPQGQAVESSLRQLGFAVGEARVGRVVDLEVEATDPAQARAEVERMCEQLLANPLIESYEIELAERVSEPQAADRRPPLPGLERRPRRALGARRARRRPASRSGTRETELPDVDRRSSCPAASRTATTSAAARSPASRRRWRPSVDFAARRRARARHLQRLPDPLRGRPAPGRAAPERVARRSSAATSRVRVERADTPFTTRCAEGQRARRSP